MKSLNMLGLVALAVAALTASIGAGTASAAGGALCSTATIPCTSRWATPTAMEFSLKSGSSTKLTATEGTMLDTCTSSSVSGTLTSNPGGSTPASGSNSSFTWGGCTVTTDTLKPGGLKVESNGAGSGKVISNATIQITVNVFSSCTWGVNSGAVLGTISEGTGTGAVFTANAVLEIISGGFLCQSTAKWVGEYVLTKPTNTTHYVSTS
jgi:hypothetical protein